MAGGDGRLARSTWDTPDRIVELSAEVTRPLTRAELPAAFADLLADPSRAVRDRPAPHHGPTAVPDIRGSATALDPSGIRQFFALRSAHNARSNPRAVRMRGGIVAAHNADDLGPPVPSALGAKREHDGNTTRTDACLREQTSTSREPAD